MHCGWIQRNRECIGQYICKYFFIALKHITFISYAIYNISNNYYKEYSVCVNLLLIDYGFLFSIPILHAFNVNIVDLKERILLLHIDNKRIWHKFNWRYENCFFDRLSDWLLWRKLFETMQISKYGKDCRHHCSHDGEEACKSAFGCPTPGATTSIGTLELHGYGYSTSIQS